VVFAVGKCYIVVVCNRYGKGQGHIVPVDPMKHVDQRWVGGIALPILITLGLDGGEWSALLLGRENHSTHC